MAEFIRKLLYDDLWRVLTDRVNLIQVVVGPRQVGKTTLALQVVNRWPGPKIYQSADEPSPPPKNWIIENWRKARLLTDKTKQKSAKTLLVLDEIQKIAGWSEVVKGLFDEDKKNREDIRVVLLGSSSLLVQKGLTESLAGRFEIHRHYHWSFAECRQAYGLSLEEYFYFGGYPGGLMLKNDEARWSGYIRDAIIETVLAKDVLLISPISKPSLLRQVFGLAVNYPAQVVSYQKMLGTLQDAGNTTTIASYLKLLANGFMVLPVERFSGSVVKQRGSTPKLIVFDNALISAMSGLSFNEAVSDRSWLGRLIENAVGMRLHILAESLGGQVFYWRQRQNEIDFVVKVGHRVAAIEVKSGGVDKPLAGFAAFLKQYPKAEPLVISRSKPAFGTDYPNVSLEDFFLNPARVLGLEKGYN